MRWRRALLGSLGAASLCGWAWVRPTTSSLPSAHDPITPDQCRLLRSVPGGGAVSPAENPGARTFPDFMPADEAETLLRELRPIEERYGINLIEPVHAAIYRWQMSYLPRPPPVNMLRVTGRPEHPQQRRPWGYGDTMDEEALPPAIRAAAARIRALPGLRLGRLRDVTLNVRHSSFLRLDPHVDPQADGENVFVLSVDAPAVLTLSPRNWYRAGRWLAAAAVGDEREQVRRDAEESWTRYDLDVLLPPGSLLHLSGDARWRWTHGTRLGVRAPAGWQAQAQQGQQGQQQGQQGQQAQQRQMQAQQGQQVSGTPGSAGAGGSGVKGAAAGGGAGGGLLLHWYGRPDDLFGPTPERHSVVFAFGAPE